MATAARQGDFIPQNVLVDGNRLGVVDFESFSKREPIVEDIAMFVAYVQALSAFPHYSQSALKPLNNAFLQACRFSGAEAPLQLYFARCTLILISELNLRRAFGRRRFQSMRAQLEAACVSICQKSRERHEGELESGSR
jgi:Ser/Thr protein kinase RdoA (MazF antagonist)